MTGLATGPTNGMAGRDARATRAEDRPATGPTGRTGEATRPTGRRGGPAEDSEAPGAAQGSQKRSGGAEATKRRFVHREEPGEAALVGEPRLMSYREAERLLAELGAHGGTGLATGPTGADG